jgi:FdhD protein
MTSRDVRVVRIGATGRREARDLTAVEEPLQIRLDGEAFAVVMRTPGADRELVAGFLFAERIVRSVHDLVELRTGEPPHDGPHNVVEVRLRVNHTPASRVAPRRVISSASCGVCGRQTIESLTAGVPPVTSGWTIGAALVSALPLRMRESQHGFASTGGLHAAALFRRDGQLDALAEDVGRHNAVDKVVGAALLGARLPLADTMLCVSGRVSYEIVQKALLAGIPIVAAVSAPSSLAIDLASTSGITLVGFVRDGSFNVYTHPERVVL